jgi:hypothetical protein
MQTRDAGRKTRSATRKRFWPSAFPAGRLETREALGQTLLAVRKRGEPSREFFGRSGNAGSRPANAAGPPETRGALRETVPALQKRGEPSRKHGWRSANAGRPPGSAGSPPRSRRGLAVFRRALRKTREAARVLREGSRIPGRARGISGRARKTPGGLAESRAGLRGKGGGERERRGAWGLRGRGKGEPRRAPRTGGLFRRVYSVGSGFGLAGGELREHEAPTRLRDCTSELFRRLDPFPDDDLYVRKRLLIRLTIGRAARELRNFGDERLVASAPVDDDLVSRISRRLLHAAHSTRARGIAGRPPGKEGRRAGTAGGVGASRARKRGSPGGLPERVDFSGEVYSVGSDGVGLDGTVGSGFGSAGFAVGRWRRSGWMPNLRSLSLHAPKRTLSALRRTVARRLPTRRISWSSLAASWRSARAAFWRPRARWPGRTGP